MGRARLPLDRAAVPQVPKPEGRMRGAEGRGGGSGTQKFVYPNQYFRL